MPKSKLGFSLLELIIVTALVLVLATWFYAATRPVKRFGEAADVQRQYDIESIEKAIKLVATDSGSLASALTGLTNNTPYMIVKAGGDTAGVYSCTALGTSIDKRDISSAIASIMPNLPMDPDLAEGNNETGYYIIKRGTNYKVETCDSYELAATVGNRQVCGDGYCGDSESCSTCPADCGICPVACGNSVCETGETCAGCIADCEGYRAGCSDIAGVSYLCSRYDDTGSLVPTCRPVCVAEAGAAVCFYQDCPQEYGSEPEADCSFVGQDICCPFP